MNAIRLLTFATLLVPVVALPAHAQGIAPLAARAVDAAPFDAVSRAVLAPAADTLPAPSRTTSRTGTVVGGFLGGVVGTFIGAGVGASSSQGCHGEMCGFAAAILGAAIGESVGVGIGSHVGSGSRSHGNMVLTSLSSAGILVGGTLLGVALHQGGVIMLPLTPALQLAAAVAIEQH